MVEIEMQRHWSLNAIRVHLMVNVKLGWEFLDPTTQSVQGFLDPMRERRLLIASTVDGRDNPSQNASKLDACREI